MYYFTATLLLRCLLLFVGSQVLSFTVPLTQLLALRDIYILLGRDTNGRRSTLFDSWEFETTDPNPCMPWTGITCNKLNTTIISLNLEKAGLGGVLPESLTALSDLTYLNLAMNNIRGPIPTGYNLGWRNMRIITMASNKLTGRVPSGPWPEVYVYNFDFNLFSGPVQWEKGLLDMTNLKVLTLSGNFLSGPLPDRLGTAFPKLQQLILSANSLSSTIPTTIGLMSSLEFLHLGGNSFVVTIPWELGHCGNLTALGLMDNNLSGRGPLPVWPDIKGGAPMFPSLKSLDVSHNPLTGPLNPLISNVTSLESLFIQSACFTGSLPEGWCSLRELSTLILVGLSDNAACQLDNKWIKKITSTPKLSTEPSLLMSGSIPGCLFALPELETLVVSGNGFGKHLVVPHLSPSLKTVVLSLNTLSGPLPQVFQKSSNSLRWLDLGSNRFSGSWDPSFAVPRDLLDLSVNRFSGLIPSTFYANNSTLSLNVLDGNLLECITISGAPSLPILDPSATSYSCADSQLLAAVYLWASLFFCTLIFFGLVTFSLRLHKGANYNIDKSLNEQVTIASKWLQTSTSYDMQLLFSKYGLKDVCNFFSVMDRLRLATTVVIGASLFILLPFYAIVKTVSPSTATYKDQYTWIASAAMLRGFSAVVAMWAFTLFLVIVLGLSLLQFTTPFSFKAMLCGGRDDYQEGDGDGQDLQKNTRGNGIPAANTARLFFRIVWTLITQGAILSINAIVVWEVNLHFILAIESNTIDTTVKSVLQLAVSLFRAFWSGVALPVALKATLRSKKSKAKMRVFLDTFNTILVPGITVLMGSNTCYYQLLHPKTQHMVFDITLYKGAVTQYGIQISPPFVYSDACASAMIMTFVPVLIYSSIIDGFLRVLLFFVLSSWKCFVTSVPRWLLPIIFDRIFYEHHELQGRQEKRVELLDAESVMSSQLLNLIILLTYGFASPFLALSVGLAVATQTFVWRLVLGRHLLKLASHENADLRETMTKSSFYELEDTIEQSWEAPQELFWPLIVLTYAFWAAVFHDFVSDENTTLSSRGTNSARLVSLIVFLVSPAAVLIVIVATVILLRHLPCERLLERLERLCGLSAFQQVGAEVDVGVGITPSIKRKRRQTTNPLVEPDTIPPAVGYEGHSQL